MHKVITVKRVDAVLSEDFLQKKKKSLPQEGLTNVQCTCTQHLNLSAIPLGAVSQQTPSVVPKFESDL